MAMQEAHRAGAQTVASRGAERDPAHDAWTVLPPRRRDGERLAEALGWFSVGIGVATLMAPRPVARMIGVSDGEPGRWLLRLVGLRELVSGLGILNHRRPTGWLWGRVAGDAMDLGLLALGSRRGGRDTHSRSVLARARRGRRQHRPAERAHADGKTHRSRP